MKWTCRRLLPSASLVALLSACSIGGQEDLCEGVTCPPPSDGCFLEGDCNPETGGCEYEIKARGEICRPAAGPCDVEEKCTGRSGKCPADGFVAEGTVCREEAGSCDVPEKCDGKSVQCPADVFLTEGIVCREVVDLCDAPETCDGQSAQCPGDSFSPRGTVCRASAGACDVAETCSGTDSHCPTDARLAAHTVCRAKAGDCDVEETCTGTDSDCPEDSFLPSTVVCRQTAGACDVEERCSGTNAQCPIDAVASSATVCRDSTAPCDAAERCTGTGVDCPPDELASSSKVCRPKAGACDIEERCTGLGSECPPDVLVAEGTVCRDIAGACDLAERCTGTSAACPADVFVAAQTVCREVAGDCDVPEKCTGTLPTCPIDAFVPIGTVCRQKAGDCDVEERCTGVGPSCPVDAFAPDTLTCRAAIGGCDVPEKCPGDGPACPTELFVTLGQECAAGSCVGGVETSHRTCDGHGACAPATTRPCAPYVCGGTACTSSCTGLDGCAPGYFCVGSACRSRESYSEYWAGGDIGGSGISMGIAPDGTRSIAAVQGRRLAVYRATAGSTTWTKELVDGFANKPSLAVGPDGTVHVAYEEQAGGVKYARRSAGGSWSVTPIDAGMAPSLAVDSTGAPHLAYHQWVGMGSVNRYARIVDGAWTTEPISQGGGMGCGCIGDPTSHCSCGREPGNPYLAVDGDGIVHVLSPRYAVYQGLEYASRGVSGWEFEEIEPTFYYDGATSIALAPSGAVSFIYNTGGNTGLRLTTDATGTWVKTSTGISGEETSSSLAVDAFHHLCTMRGVLTYTTDRSGAWTSVEVESSLPHSRFCSLALDSAGKVHIAYSTGDTGSLKVADNVSGAWSTSFVEQAQLFGGRVSLAVDAAGVDHVAAARRAFLFPAYATSFYDYDAMYWTNGSGTPVGTSLTTESLVTPNMDVKCNAGNVPHIAYYHGASGADGLFHATLSSGAWTRTRVMPQTGAAFVLAIDRFGDGFPRIALNADRRLELAAFDGSAWSRTTIANEDGGALSMVMGPAGVAHLIYSATYLRYATNASGSWVTSVANPNSTSLMPTAIARSASGTLHLAFFNGSSGFHYANNSSGSWALEPVVPTNGVSASMRLSGANAYSIVLDDADVPHIVFTTGGQDLIEVIRRPAGWEGHLLDRAVRWMDSASAARAPDGKIHIIYIAEGALYRIVE